MVPKPIQLAVLNKYLLGCLRLYQIAFFQWRAFYVPFLHDNTEYLKEEIGESIEKHFKKEDEEQVANPKLIK